MRPKPVKIYKEFTMRNKFIVIGFLVMAVMLSACGSLTAGNAVASTGNGGSLPRTISVNGTTQIILTPDIAFISIGVHSEAQDAQEAMASNNQQSQTVIDALLAAGVDMKDIQTVNFSIYHQEKYSPTGEVQEKVFAVDNTVYVKIRDLDGLGSLLDTVIQAGANTVYGISFDVEDKQAAIAQGREAALEDARMQAEQLAEAAGVSLGAVYSISTYSNAPIPMAYDVRGMGGGAAEAMASVPISPGQLTLTVDVSVVYEIQ